MAKLLTKNQGTNTAEHVQAAYVNTKDVAQDFLARTKKTARSTFKLTRNATQDRLAKAQNSAKVGLDKAQNFLATCVALASAIGALLYEKQRKAQEEMKKAQVALLKTAIPIVEKTQDVVVTSTKRASQSLQQATDNAKEATESLQNWYVHYQRKRRRNRILFRIGLLAGLALALFYAPLAGSDMRQRIVQQWRQYRSYFGR